MFGTDQVLDSKTGNSLGWDTMTLTTTGSTTQFGFSESGAAQQIFTLTEMTGANDDLSVKFSNASGTDVNTVQLTLTGGQTLRIQLFGNGPSAGLDFTIQRVSATAECN